MPSVVCRGTDIFYVEAGNGDPPLVLLHGWSGDHAQVAPQFAHFAERHRVLAPDLRHHGLSGYPADDCDIGSFADEIRELIDHAGMKAAVVVGHSLGGAVALELGARHPHAVIGVVALDAGLFAIDEEARSRAELFRMLLDGDLSIAAEAFSDAVFLDGDDAALKATVTRDIASQPPESARSIWDALLAWDSAAAVRSLTVPTHVVWADPPATDPNLVTALNPLVTSSSIPGTGHYLQLLAPEAVIAEIESFLGRLSALPEETASAGS